jgi:hypothetical protein
MARRCESADGEPGQHDNETSIHAFHASRPFLLYCSWRLAVSGWRLSAGCFLAAFQPIDVATPAYAKSADRILCVGLPRRPRCYGEPDKSADCFVLSLPFEWTGLVGNLPSYILSAFALCGSERRQPCPRRSRIRQAAERQFSKFQPQPR